MGLVWNSMGWFEISQVGLKSHGLVWNLTGFIWNLTRFVWNLTGFVWNLMGFFWITWGHLKYHRFLYLIKKIGNCRGASSLQQPSINLVVKSPSWSWTPKFNLDINLHRGFEPRFAFVEIFLCWVQIPLTQNEDQGQKGNLTFKLNKGLQPWRLI